MEESDLDLLFLSILLLLTVVLSISLRLHALHIPNKGFKKRLDITPLPKEVAKGDIIIRSPPSASTSPGAASGEEENVVGWTRVDSYPNPRFPEPHELPKKSRATVVEVVAMRMCSASELISKRQIIRDSQEKLISAKLSVDLCATSDLRRFPELPANLCSGFFEECEPLFVKHPWKVESRQRQVLKWMGQVAFGNSSIPRLTWSRSWMICHSELIKVTSGDINFGALTSYSEKIHLPISEVGVGDDETADRRNECSRRLANIPQATAPLGTDRITAR